MPKTKISEFSATANSNTDINSINIAEGCAPSNINDAIRELMAELKDFQAGTNGDSFNGPVNGTVGATTPASGAFTTLSSTGNTTLGDASGDTVTINGTATFVNVNPTLSAGTANGVLYLNGSKVATSGSALTFDGSTFTAVGLVDVDGVSGSSLLRLRQTTAGAGTEFNTTITENTGVTFDCTDGGTTARSFIWTQVGSEQMRLTSTGLGIGTSSPSARLEVAGDASPILRLTSTSGPYSQIQSNTAGTLQLMADEGNTGASTSMRFRIDGSEVARFDSSGNLGLGVTPSAWYSNNKVMQLGASSSILGRSDVNLFEASSNQYVNSGATATYIASDYASKYRQYQGQHVFYTAASGTAGNAITFTQAMTLDASGNLGVGTTSPGAKLDVRSSSGSAVFGIIGTSTATNPGAGLVIAGSGNSNKNWVIANQYNVNGGLEFTQTTAAAGTTIGSTPSMVLDSSGNLLVGTTSAVEKLTVAGNISINTSGNPYLQIKTSGSGNNPYIRLQFDTNYWDIQGTGSNAGKELYFIYSGNARSYINSSTGAYTAVSDKRLKKNIANISFGLQSVMALRPVEYLMVNETEESQKHLGFIAQEAQLVIPSSVSEMTGGTYGMDKTEIVPVLVKAIQELKAEFDAYKATHP